ncbi:ABC transporter permease subunit [candidate division GN15 bacterium]|nr:ABC transporter permease subunit [candidate division GN15 bacterium]
MRGITRDTVVELVDKKFLWLYGIVTGLACLLVFFVGQADARIQIETGNEDQMAAMMAPLVVRAVSALAGFLVFITVMMTAGLLPRMLEKGRVDFYLSKPVSRAGFLANKLFAVWIVYGAIITVCLGIMTAVSSAVFGGIDGTVLYVFGIVWVLLAIWFSVTSFIGVWTTSTVLAIVATFVVYVLHLLLRGRDVLFELFEARWLQVILDGLYYALPKPIDISTIVDRLIADMPVESWMPLWSSLVFAVVLYVSAALVFKSKDY